jgi:predicted lipid-binding transport protein (Tim44 family)
VEILFFALIAGFLVFRLRSVLGRRHGEERQRPNLFSGERTAPPVPDNVIVLPERGRTVDSRPTGADEPLSLGASLDLIRAADPRFDEKHFLAGARAAFGMIVDAFARGDTAALRPLLSDDVFASFSSVIRARTAAGETHETRVERIRELEISEAKLEGQTAVITATIVSDQVNVSRDALGAVIDGDPVRPAEITDIWTFARNTRSDNPNWTLVGTRTPN